MTDRVLSSFRDPSGQVHERNGRIFRTVRAPGRADFEFVRGTGFLEAKVRSGQVVSAEIVPRESLAEVPDDAAYVLEHPRVPFVSHAYEWSFYALRAAALLTLDLHREALAHGVSMSDASTYNVQFDGPKPLLIDYLSFRRYEDGEFWAGHRQFCEQFLHPLLLTAVTGVPFHALLRGHLNGIPAAELVALLPTLRRFTPRVLMHVWLPAKLSGSQSASRATKVARRKLSKSALAGMLEAMHSWVSDLKPPRGHTAWQSYAGVNSYSDTERGEKAEFVRAFAARERPSVIWDLGCNTGDYSRVALEAGAERALGFDTDQGSLNAGFQRAERENLRFLPLYQDMLNPSPSQGWREGERLGLESRTRPDAVLMLALIHHLAIANNVPLEEVVDWATALAPAGIIEFVPKEDPMVQTLLALRKDIFPDYTREAFLAALRKRARVVATSEVTNTGRLLVAFERQR